MFDRLDEFAKTLPEPRFGGSWDVYYQQHVRNAERMRAQAFKYAVHDLGRGLRATGRRVSSITRRERADLAPAARCTPAPQEGAD